MDKLQTILSLMKLPGVGAVRLRRAISILDEAQVPIEEAFSDSGRRLLITMGLSPSSPQSVIGSIAEQLRRDEVHCFVAPFHDLALSSFARKNLPPVLFARGPARENGVLTARWGWLRMT